MVSPRLPDAARPVLGRLLGGLERCGRQRPRAVGRGGRGRRGGWRLVVRVGHGGFTRRLFLFQRGQFTFNRRFIETKFSGFFGIVRRDAEKDMILLIKSTRGEFPASRITRSHFCLMRLATSRKSIFEPYTSMKLAKADLLSPDA